MNTNKENLNNGYIYFHDQNLLAGDIILTTTDTATSKMIRCGTQSEFSHAMMMINKCSYIHAIASGVESNNLQRDIFDKREYMKVFRLKNRDEYAKRLEQAVSHLAKDIAKPYSVTNAFNAQLKMPLNLGSLKTHRYCSQLVALAYKNAGLELVKDPYHCTPEEIAQSELLERIDIKLTGIDSDEIPKFYKLELQTPNLLPKHNQQIKEAVTKIQKITSNSNLSFDDIDCFLVKNRKFDKEITSILIECGFFSFYQKIKEQRPYRYGSFKEFKKFIDKNFNDIQEKENVVNQLKQMAIQKYNEHQKDLETVEQTQKDFGNLELINEKIKLYKNLCEMYKTLQNNCEQYIF